MASFRANRAFVAAVLRSEATARALEPVARRVAASAGPGWRVVRGDTRDRARFAVIPGDLGRIYDDAGHSASAARDNLRRALL